MGKDTACECPMCGCDCNDPCKECPGCRIAELEAGNAELREKCEGLKREAESHAMEARAQRTTVQECYPAVTRATGEPGDWNGSKPVVEGLERLREKLARVEGAAGELRGGAMSIEQALEWHAEENQPQQRVTAPRLALSTLAGAYSRQKILLERAKGRADEGRDEGES